MAEGLLSGCKVVDASGQWGASCSAFLASLGAQVTNCEIAGASWRTLANGQVNPLWLARNFDKHHLALDLDSPADRDVLQQRVGEADFLIDAFAAPRAAELGLDPDALQQRHPKLIHISITPFGRDGAYSGCAAEELVASAMGGTLAAVGYEDRAPVKEAGDACIFHAGMMAAAGAMFAHYERDASGLGQHVDVSVQEVAASRMTSAILAWQFDQRPLKRSGVHVSYGHARVRYVWDLKDGYCFHGLMSGRTGAPANQALSRWMDEAGFENPMRDVDWISYDRGALPADVRLIWEAAIDRFFRAKTKAEIAGEGRARGINAAVAYEPDDLLRDPHLAARAFFADKAGDDRTVRAPSRFLSVSPPSDRAAPVRPASPQALPLAGVKVLDFSWALVGSLTTKALADFGADVVKVESATRPCLTRLDVQVRASKRGNFNDKPWFIHLNTSKLSLQLNMKHPRVREIIDPLIDWADIVVENFSPGTMASLGLSYAQLGARRPDLIMLSGSVYGQSGPLTREWGVDGTGAALSGRLYLTGYADRPPVNPSFAPYGDVVLPPMMAACAAAALAERRRTGRGRHIDASMWEACIQQMGGAIVQTQAGAKPMRLGNRDPALLHQGVYATRGEDRWIAIAFSDGAAWSRFTEFLGGSWPTGTDILSSSPAALDDLDRRIGDAIADQEGYALMHALQARGIAAGVVQTAADLIDRDPQLRARGFLRALDNPALGTFGHQATPVALSRTPSAMRTAPNLGQHNRQIACEILGLPESLFDELHHAKLFE
jgi:crotonobetainyl-CoA:carnitine CoA-transferase CaiB-like acyl-CoA transferase